MKRSYFNIKLLSFMLIFSFSMNSVLFAAAANLPNVQTTAPSQGLTASQAIQQDANAANLVANKNAVSDLTGGKPATISSPKVVAAINTPPIPPTQPPAPSGFQSFVDFLNALAKLSPAFWQSVNDTLTKAAQAINNLLTAAAPLVKQIITTVGNVLKVVSNIFGQIFTNLPTIINSIVQNLPAIINYFITNFSGGSGPSASGVFHGSNA